MAGIRHQVNGDYDEAASAYLAVLDGAPSPEDRREARYRLAETYVLAGDHQTAVAALEDYVRDYPQDERRRHVVLMLARAYDAGGDCARAITHYQGYLTYDTTLGDRVHEWIADCHLAEGRLEDALSHYQRALEAAPDRAAEVALREKIADVHQRQGDYAAAVAQYDAILQVARLDSLRARMEYMAGQALIASGRVEDAHARYRVAVQKYPEVEHAYLSLVELVNAGEEVGELQRGLVDYHAGEAHPDAYGAAILAFDRYLAAGPTARVDEARYHKALAQRASGEGLAALGTLDTLIAEHAASKWLVPALLERAAILASMGETGAAVEVYRDVAVRFPEHERAPNALWRAAKLGVEEGSHALAAELFDSVAAAFPAFEDADEALWRAGLAYYRAGEVERAVASWEKLLAGYPNSSFRSKSLYWLGKVGASPAAEGSRGYWDQLLTRHPTSYYALRVEQIQAGDSLTATRLISMPVVAMSWEPAQAQEEMLAWLATWTQVPADTALSVLPDSLASRRDLARGQEFLAVGMRRDSLDTLDNLLTAAWDDPLLLAPLAFYYRDEGFYGLAARSALRLAALWPGGTIDTVPSVVRRLAYPLAYADLLSAEAQESGLDPMLLAALIRQESLFEPVAESYAGARGLGQVMPATGQGIANSLDIHDFVLDDLYRPSVSIRFGAWYLAVQMRRFDGQILVALAAYNGGPGNTLRWMEDAGTDLDLFVESITADQSRRYLQRVYTQFLIYEELYRRGGGGEQ